MDRRTLENITGEKRGMVQHYMIHLGELIDHTEEPAPGGKSYVFTEKSALQIAFIKILSAWYKIPLIRVRFIFEAIEGYRRKYNLDFWADKTIGKTKDLIYGSVETRSAPKTISSPGTFNLTEEVPIRDGKPLISQKYLAELMVGGIVKIIPLGAILVQARKTIRQ